MNRTKQFFRTFSTIGLTKCGRQKAIGPENPAWLLVAVVGAGIWASRPCEGQIQSDAYISNLKSTNVSVIDTASKTLVGPPISTGPFPIGVAVTPDGRYTYVANNASNTVTVIDATTNTVVGSAITVGANPFGVSATPDGKLAYVTNFGSNTVSVIDTTTNAVVGAPISVGIQPVGVTLSPDGRFAYVTNSASGSVSVINTATNQVTSTIPVGATPEGVTLSPNGALAYVTNVGAGTVSVINTVTNLVTSTIPVGNTPVGVVVSPDSRFVYVANKGDNSVSVINAATNTVIATPSTGGAGPFGISITRDGKFVYVGNTGSNNVSVIDAATNQVVGASIPVGSNPFVFGSFIGPNIIVAQGGPLLVANDAALTTLGFGNPSLGFPTFVDFNGGTLKTTGSLIASRTISLLALGGTIDTNGFDSIFSGDIINSGSLTKIGTGTLTLSGNNTFSGGTDITGGVLRVSTDSNLGTGNINISNNAELLNTGSLTSSKAITLGIGGGTIASAANTIAAFSGVFSGSGSLRIGDASNTGKIILTADNTYSGGTSVTAGSTLQLGNGGITGSVIGNIADNGVLIVDHGNTLTMSGTISGTGSLIQNGTGTLTLSGNSSYSGTTIVSTGTLRAGSTTGFSSNSAFTINSTLDLDGFNNAIGSLSGNGTVTNNGAAIATLTAGSDNTSTTFSGILQDGTSVLQLKKTGIGTLLLTGNNTYSGVTTISAGTLQLGNGGTSGSIAGDVTNNGALVFDRSDTPLAFTGLITGTGTVSQNGTGTTVLSGNNSYSGPTNVNLGTLRAGSTTALSPLSAFIVNSLLDLNGSSNTIGSLAGNGTVANNGAAAATLTTGNDNTSTSFNGNIADGSGTIAITKIGTGTQTLSGSNTYSGDTNVNSGILRAASTTAFSPNSAFTVNSVLNLNGNSNTVGSLAGNGTVTDNGVNPATLTAGRNNTNTTFSGTLTDGSSKLGFTKSGTGTTVLSGINTYSGRTVLNAGTLTVGNLQALGLGDVVVNGGTLNADRQPINVNGNYTQNANGTLQLNITGKNPGQFDFLNVRGNAVLNGTLSLANVGYLPQAGDKLTLVTSGGTVSGQFGHFVDPFSVRPGLNTIDLIYGKHSIVLEFLNQTTPVSPVIPTVPTNPSVVPPTVIATIDFASFALTPNGLAAATLLDQVQLNPRAATLISFLEHEPFAQLPAEFEKISPEGLTAVYEIGFSGANIQKLNLEGRLDDIRNGSNGFSSNVKINAGPSVPLEAKATVDGKSSKNVLEPVLQPAPENHWGVWLTGFGDFVSVDADFNAHGYNFTSGGFSLGIDYRLTDHLAIGVLASYSHTWTDLRPDGHMGVDTGRGEVYATYFHRGFYLNGAIYGGYNTYDSSRQGLGALAAGSSDGAEFSTFIGGGYDFHFGHLSVGPTASLQYTNVYINSFNEKGSLAPLSIHSDSEESLRTDLGLRASYQWKVGRVIVEPSVKAVWEHEFKYSALPITAGFVGISGPSATFLGPAEGHDGGVVGAGISVQWTPTFLTYVNYDGQLGRDRYDSNAVTGGVRISF